MRYKVELGGPGAPGLLLVLILFFLLSDSGPVDERPGSIGGGGAAGAGNI